MSSPTYAVFWNERSGPRFAGRFDVGESSAELSGSGAEDRAARVRILFDQIAGLSLSRDRLRIDRRNGEALEIGSVDGPGALRELAERLAAASVPPRPRH